MDSDADPINANPTVLDASALPTRQASKSHGATTNSLLPLLGVPQKFSSTDTPFSLFDDLSHSLSDPEALSDSASILSSASSSFSSENYTDNDYEPIDSQEIFDLISTISDPEHPLSLGQLAVVNLPHIYVSDTGNPNEMAEVFVEITPTITHCGLATLIGLGLRVRLERCLPPRYRITIKVRAGTHQSERQVNKQLNDKERVAAACENEQLLGVIANMLATCV